MRYFFDTEFIEDGRTIDLLSMGMVAEDGRELYLENCEADLTKASPWVRENVFPGMTWKGQVDRRRIAREVRSFVAEIDPDCAPLDTRRIPKPSTKPEFWAYYADYDWVVLCQLFGRMIDLPKGWPMYCRDFKQWLDEHGNPPLQKLPEASAHNALEDARWLRNELYRLRGEPVLP